MTGTRAGHELAKWMGITLAVLLTGYVGVYLLIVETALRHYTPRPTGPLHWLDRQIRPAVWRERDKEGPPVI